MYTVNTGRFVELCFCNVGPTVKTVQAVVYLRNLIDGMRPACVVCTIIR